MKKDDQALVSENEELRSRLAEAEETLRAIHGGEVDALVVSGKHGDQIYTLKGADRSYRILIEEMNEGAATLTEKGLILYCNRCFAQMVKTPQEKVIGGSIYAFIPPEDRKKIKCLFKTSVHERSRGDIYFKTSDGIVLPVNLSINTLGFDDIRTICLVATDQTEQRQIQEKMIAYQKDLRSLASELSLAEERQRRQIAITLHDHIGQSLALSKIKLNMLRELPPDDHFPEQLKEICDLVQQSIEFTRSLTCELSPPVLYEFGFEAAVHELAEQIRRKHNLVLEVHDDKLPKPMNDDVRVVLFQAVRELIFNIIKHARAGKTNICIRKDKQNIRVNVKDNGVGFQCADLFPLRRQDKVPQSKGFGLFSIKERLDHLGGQLHIVSGHRKGTCVTLSAPLKPSTPSS